MARTTDRSTGGHQPNLREWLCHLCFPLCHVQFTFMGGSRRMDNAAALRHAPLGNRRNSRGRTSSSTPFVARSRDRFSRGNPWLSSPVGPDRLAPHVSTLGRVHQEVVALGTHDDDGGLAILHGSGHHRRSGWTSVQRTGRCSRGSWPLSRRRNGTDDDRANRSGT